MTLEVMAKADGPIPLNVDFSVAPGEVLALVGPSGSGKTTLLRSIAGLCHPDNGRIVVNGATWLDTGASIDLAAHKRRVGMVFQNYALFPHMTAARNIITSIDHLPPVQRMTEALRLLDLVQLNDLADRKPAQLSGGQQQRVAVARALARRPAALLLDEPFSAVDRATREQLQASLISLREHLSMPTIIVTHDMNEAQLLADRVLVLREGRAVAYGPTAEVMSDPHAMRTMGIREVAALLPALVAEQEEDGMTRLDTATGPIWLPRIEAPVGARVRVRILAHEVLLARERPTGLSAQNILPATITDIRPGDGPGVMVELALGEDQILARITRRAVQALALETGSEVHVILKAMSVARNQIATQSK
ncbi:molybdenum ABC transporter ATP-binding protein [Sulfitobacter sp. S223]|uniref:molybdenum ABC transporter ATP-binding protein n=1 Tax=Sulfitobacter sp. S223 TaxID=2867023 RepID=UPI0021A79D7A|nr:molybdenum ABC transporter ATP-binding protein [Sulfitobacter sp. S223]UWR25214.1 molybdenum ABC transporter ATP-binding protein [Sulfitobacter sp. S223]